MEEQATKREGRSNGDGTVGDEDAFTLPAGLKPAKGTVVIEYTFWPALHGDEKRGDIKAVIWELSFREDKLAMKRGRGEMADSVYQLLRMSIRAVDGDPVDWTDGGKADVMLDRLLEDIGQKGRALLLEAYKRMSIPTEEESEAFFGRARVGTAG
jgi:hypothetical protein